LGSSFPGEIWRRAWVRYGLIGGVIAFTSTLAANLAIILLRPADLCRAGPVGVLLLNLGAVIILIWMAAAAGFATARRAGTVGQATISGVLVGLTAGCALIAFIPFIPAGTQRLQELNARCPAGISSGGGSFSFSFGPTPPPGVVIPTPPPSLFSTLPPPEAFASPPPGLAGVVSTAFGALFTISFGVGLAAGAAALAGLAGAATRPRRDG
jgi:hypothetical protein